MTTVRPPSPCIEIPDEKMSAFAQLPHKNPFFDIHNAIKFVIPLNVSYSQSVRSKKLKKEIGERVVVIQQAYEQLRSDQDQLFIKCFHRLSEEFLKEYRTAFPDKRIQALVSPRGDTRRTKSYLDSPRNVRDAILSQEVRVYAYFDNFYTLSQQYLDCIRESQAALTAKQKKKGQQ